VNYDVCPVWYNCDGQWGFDKGAAGLMKHPIDVSVGISELQFVFAVIDNLQSACLE